MVDNHPALKAASPQAPITDWFVGDDFHHNGALFLPHAFRFLTGFGKENIAACVSPSYQPSAAAVAAPSRSASSRSTSVAGRSAYVLAGWLPPLIARLYAHV